MTTEFSHAGRQPAPTPSPTALRRARQQAEISQTAIARELGVSAPRITQMELYQKTVTAGFAQRFWRALAKLQAEGRARHD